VVKKGLHQGTELYGVPYHVNDPAFASEVVRVWQRFCLTEQV
jgi:uncharacterized protein (UPF0261 family)